MFFGAGRVDLTNFHSYRNPIEALKPKYTYNPALQHFYQVLQSRAMQPETPLPPLDPLIEKYVKIVTTHPYYYQHNIT